MLIKKGLIYRQAEQYKTKIVISLSFSFVSLLDSPVEKTKTNT